MKCSLGDLIRIIETELPLTWAQDWDNSGLQIGGFSEDIKRVLIALDPTMEVLNEAIVKNVDLVLTHHPLLFTPLKRINPQEYIDNIVFNYIKNDISLLALHTNFDVSHLARAVGKKIGLSQMVSFGASKKGQLFKVVVFVPTQYADKLMIKMGACGAGHIGNYSDCFFLSPGQGTFRAGDHTNPFIGKRGALERVEETRLETIVTNEKLQSVIQSIKKYHPYEEVAYDIYPLANSLGGGFGVLGQLEKPLEASTFLQFLKHQFSASYIKISHNLASTLQKIAVVPGKGASFITEAQNKGCDVFISSDFDHHHFVKANEMKMALIDLGHYNLEREFKPYLKALLEDAMTKTQFEIEFILAQEEKEPYAFFK